MNSQTVCRVFENFFWINVFSSDKIVEIFFIKFFKNWILCFNCFFRTKNSIFDLILNFYLKNLLYLNSCLSDLSSKMKSKAKMLKTKWFCDLFKAKIIFVNSLTSENLICEKNSEMNSDFDVKKSSLWKSWFEFFDFAHSSTFVKLIFINLWFKNSLYFFDRKFWRAWKQKLIFVRICWKNRNWNNYFFSWN